MEEKNSNKIKQEKQIKTKARMGRRTENRCGPKVDSQEKRNRSCKDNGPGKKEIQPVCKFYVKGIC